MATAEDFSPERVKHLEMIQAVITRLANNSFLIKGWTLTIAAAFFAFLAKNLSWKIAATAYIPVVAFWLLDAYYLRQERLYRYLYEDARRPESKVEPFSMSTARYTTRVGPS